MKQTTTPISKALYLSLALLISGFLLPPAILAQSIPTAGEVECFQIGDGGFFVDPGGAGGSSTSGTPGNYLNCDCVTTTTLCAPDGSAVTVDFLALGMVTTFDWLVILDGDNPDNSTYPMSLLDDPANASFQLFNNADGTGDGGSENYGAGAQINIGNLALMSSTSFTATNPSGCLTFVFRASGTVSSLGWECVATTAGGIGHPGDNIGCDDFVNCIPPGAFFAVTSGGEAELQWNASPSTDTYLIEYGPQGFVPGTGTTVQVTGTSTLLTGLQENTFYDAYIQSVCDSELSLTNGPINFYVPFIGNPSTCEYTLNLTNIFGGGWFGSTLTIDVAGMPTAYTLAGGGFESIPVNVVDGYPLTLTYSGFIGQNQIEYELLDSDGQVVFADGPFPENGLVYDENAVCPDCPGISTPSVVFSDITSNSAQVSWAPSPTAVAYILEYGPSGFPQGFGPSIETTNTSVTLTGLNPFLGYDVYITSVCDGDITGNPIGPFSFNTLTDGVGGGTCNYVLNLFDSFGDGWNGASMEVTSGPNVDVYTLQTGSFGTFNIPAISNLPLTFAYSTGTFENEVSFEIIDPDGNIIYADGPFPQSGEILSIIACPTCAGPFSLTATSVGANTASFEWPAPIDPGVLALEYGPIGFTLGTGTQVPVTGTTVTVTGLNENTYYEFYLSYLCDDGEVGATVGPVRIRTIFLIDVGVSALLTPAPTDCNLGEETITLLLQNYGQAPQSLIPFFYSINGVPANIPVPLDGFYTGVLGKDSTDLVSFEVPYDFSAPGYYLIELWTELPGDSNAANDTLRVEIITAFPLPLQEDFEAGVLPDDWTITAGNGALYAPNAHNNPTWVLGSNVWTANQVLEVTSDRVGPMGVNDSLYFDYRFANWSAGTIGTNLLGNTLTVFISDDCEDTFEVLHVVDSSNHVTTAEFTTVGLSLADYEGKAITVRFRVNWSSGDYWFDIDNINVTGCPATLLVSGNASPSTNSTQGNGSIQVSTGLGKAPFTYTWDNAATGSSITGLDPGDYTVTVTDANGCTDEATFSVSLIVDAQDVPQPFSNVKLVPNPTQGYTQLQADLNRSGEVQIQLYNATGQLIYYANEDQPSRLRHDLDLTQLPNGMYFVVLGIDGKVQIEKLVLQK